MRRIEDGLTKYQRYRERHPDRCKAAKDAWYEKNKGNIKRSPAGVVGSEGYKKYRASEKYRRSNMNSHLKRKYGITFEDYEAMYEKQKGCCSICGGTTPNRNWKIRKTQYMKLFVDHDHKTGKVRGLLCNTCNVGIAALKESVDILQSAIRYLSMESST